MLDSGGLAKGLFADELVASLSERRSVAIDCGGDLRARRRRRASSARSRSRARSTARCCTLPPRARRRRDDRDRAAQLARRRRPPGAPPARPRDADGPPSPGIVQATALAPSGGARRGARQGGGPERARGRRGLAALGRRDRARRRLAPRRSSRAARASAPAERRAGGARPRRAARPEHRVAAGAQLGAAEPEGGGQLRGQLLRAAAAGRRRSPGRSRIRRRRGTPSSPRSRCPRRRPSGRGCAPGRSSSARSPRSRVVSRISRHERAVDLQLGGRQLGEVLDRGVAGPEVVDRDPDAHLAQRLEHPHAAIGVGHRRALGDLDHELLGRHAVLARAARRSAPAARGRAGCGPTG